MRVRLFVAATLLVGLAGCGQPTLIGRWQGIMGFGFEFHEGGSATLLDVSGPFPGTWNEVSKGHVDLSFPSLRMKGSCTYSFSTSGNTTDLILADCGTGSNLDGRYASVPKK
ncbi:hypothetical protein [Mesorhizobium sp. GbtcB19]|uniref:hypothetical protein n=1 Tax=Mesorhizobium sp. GbtcB19 TaxID=2824764 RepID=UPI001C301B46|nr:hypothetical protein [Mesorhizobium sp. GbtcB19]